MKYFILLFFFTYALEVSVYLNFTQICELFIFPVRKSGCLSFAKKSKRNKAFLVSDIQAENGANL